MFRHNAQLGREARGRGGTLHVATLRRPWRHRLDFQFC